MNRDQLAAIIDHTLLRADATRGQVETMCREAREFGFAALCVNPVHVYHDQDKPHISFTDFTSMIVMEELGLRSGRNEF